jgi:lipid-binding SYLF domain-containing protein
MIATHSRFGIALAATLAVALSGIGLAAHASDKSDAEMLVAKAKTTIQSVVADSDFASLRPALASARGVLIFPQVLKAGFVLGGSGGSGVLLARDAASGAWTGPAFYTMGSASIGFQAGAQAAEMVMVVTSQKALDSLYTNKVNLGGDASVALASKGAGRGANVTADFIVYSKVKGAFAGVSVDGSVLDVRQGLNSGYYGQAATPLDILVKRAVTNPDSTSLQAAVADADK